MYSDVCLSHLKYMVHSRLDLGRSTGLGVWDTQNSWYGSKVSGLFAGLIFVMCFVSGIVTSFIFMVA